MAYDQNGLWKPEDASVDKQITGLLKAGNPLLTQAQTSAKQAANRRGLINSSMGVQAGEQALISTALPIASQNAAQIQQSNLATDQLSSQEKIAKMNVDAHDRQYQASYAAEVNKKYGAMWTEVMKNNDLSAEARDNYFKHISALRDDDLSLWEQLYNVDIDWESAVPAAA